MKKLLIAVIVLAVIAVSLTGYLLYQSGRIYVEDAVYMKNSQELDLRGMDISVQHYEAVHAQLPGCTILWDVPFQGKTVESNATVLKAKGFTTADLQMIPYFTQLKTLEVTDCKDYALLEGLQAILPRCSVNYEVDLGGSKIDRFATELNLTPGSYEYDVMVRNLKHLPDMEQVTFQQTELDAEKFAAICKAYPNISFDYTVELLGMELTAETTTADLSQMTSEDLEDVIRKLPLLASLETIQLPDGTEKDGFTLEQAKKLKDAAPNVKLQYTFSLYGETVNTDMEEMTFRNKRKYINNDTLPQLRQALEIMKGGPQPGYMLSMMDLRYIPDAADAFVSRPIRSALPSASRCPI